MRASASDLKNLPRIAVIALAALTFACPPASATLDRCAELLVHAAVERNPIVIRATLFRTLTTDYAVLFRPRANYITLRALSRNFALPKALHFTAEPMSPIDFIAWPYGPLSDFIGKVREAPEAYRSAIDLAVDETWSALKSDFLDRDQSLRARRDWLYIHPRDFDEIAAIFRTIDGNAPLKREMRELIEEILLNADAWWPEAGHFGNGAQSRNHYFETMRKRSAEFAAMTKLKAEHIAEANAVPPTASTELSELRNFFRAAHSPTKDGEIIDYDQLFYANLHRLVVRVAEAREEFASHFIWEDMYTRVYKWLDPLEVERVPLLQAAVVADLDKCRLLADHHLEILAEIRDTLDAAETSAGIRIDALKSISPATNDVKRTLERATADRLELKILRETLEPWQEKIAGARAPLSELRTKVEVTPRWRWKRKNFLRELDRIRAIFTANLEKPRRKIFGWF